MSELPNGWKIAQLAEICSRIVDGSHNPPKAVEQGFPMLSARNIQARQILFDEFRYISPDDFSLENARTAIEAGDVLLTIVGAIGRSAVVPKGIEAFALQRSVAVLKPQVIDSRFLSYSLESPEVQKFLLENAKGTAQKGIYLKALSQVEIPLPPLNEQKRIAAKLDALLARVDACRARLERVPLLLKRFRQAVLAAATSGQLTEDWRREEAKDWIASTLSECGTVGGGLTKNQNRATLPMKRPFLRVANVYANRLELGDVAEIGLTEVEFTKTVLSPNDLLLVEGNGSLEQIGRVAMWNGEIPHCVHQNHLIRWRAGNSVLPTFVLYWLMSPQGRDSLMRLASSTTGLHTLSISKVSAVPLEIPSIEEQSEIVRRVETLFAYADRLEARYQQARAEVERLTPALLAKAFRGELVPQDPNDEPAAALLTRLQAERAESDAKPRVRAKSNPVSALDDPAAPVSPATQREEPAAGLVAIAQPDSPPRNQTGATNGHQPAPLDIDDYDRETLLAAIRDVFQQGARYDTDSAIRTISHALGYARTGARIHQRLKNTLRVAVQRGILVNESGAYRLDCCTIQDYPRDLLLQAFLAAMGRAWITRDEAIKLAARYLGFRRTGSAIQEAFKSIINGAIRRGLVETDRELIRKL